MHDNGKNIMFVVIDDVVGFVDWCVLSYPTILWG